MYGVQHGALAHTEQQAIKGPKITSRRPSGLRKTNKAVNSLALRTTWHRYDILMLHIK